MNVHAKSRTIGPPRAITPGLSSYIYGAYTTSRTLVVVELSCVIHQIANVLQVFRQKHEMIFVHTAITLALFGSHLTRAAEDWTYWGDNGPEHWSGVCTKGKKQSPIDIVSEDAIKMDLGTLRFTRYDYAFSGTVINTGHTVQIKLDGLPILLTGGGLPSTFALEQMHFHWDAEHTIDGVRLPLELHFVHYDKQYGNVSIASQHEHGVAVVAVLFRVSDDDNKDLEDIVKSTKLVLDWVGGSRVDTRTKVVPHMLLPKDRTSYYRYEGSLTTPGCQESVIWFVLSEKLKVSQTQINVFKHLETRNGTLKFNYRPIQDVNARTVYHHLEGYSSATSISSNLLYTLLGVLLVKLFQSSSEL